MGTWKYSSMWRTTYERSEAPSPDQWNADSELNQGDRSLMDYGANLRKKREQHSHAYHRRHSADKSDELSE